MLHTACACNPCIPGRPAHAPRNPPKIDPLVTTDRWNRCRNSASWSSAPAQSKLPVATTPWERGLAAGHPEWRGLQTTLRQQGWVWLRRAHTLSSQGN
eukprot:13032713-Alexandrium_andersonii.AAC.1